MSETTIRSVSRALSILQVFRNEDAEITLSEIARRSGLNKMTALRLLGTLEEHRYVDRLGSGGYRLGGAVMELAQVFSSSLRLEDYVMPSLQRLAEASAESSAYYRRDKEFRLCLFRVDSGHQVRAQTRVGDRVPLPEGGFGRTLLRFEDPEYCQKGCAALVISHGERNPDLATVAAPVFDFTQKIVGTIGISLPSFRYSDEVEALLCAIVLREAINVTEKLGGNAEFLRAAEPENFIVFDGR
jgi:DNA-binding IclR family transcriptional regulator